ncbi:MAG TPA: adenylate/guanylate cyclase domain-containing protein [Bacteroidota bacterium]|nr:adenylate/guanylate cyclase domain-containing protein [Bacteroidota bacterium]
MSSPQDSSTRKLAAIMFTDIKAFSWKMATNEIAAMQILKTHDSMMKESIEKHGGRVIKSIGDSFMVDFPSAVNAVLCAIELQERFWEFNKDKSEFDKIEVRMGLHLGDVIDVGNDMYGDGVNIASRVEAITEPNRICITQDIYSQIKKKMPNLSVFPIGPMKFKNIDEPVEVYEILMDNIPELSMPSQTAKQAPSRKTAEKTAEREAKEAKTVEAKRKKLEEEHRERIKIHYKKAEIYFQKGMLEEAEAELNEIEKLTGGSTREQRTVDKEEEEKQKKVQTLYKKAEELFRAGNLDEAEKQIQEIYRIVPIHYGAQMIMAQIEEERFRRAEERRLKIEAERRAMQKKADQLADLKRKVETHINREEYSEGLELVKQMFQLDPDNSDGKALEADINARLREKQEREQAAAEEAQRILQATLEKRAEQAAKAAAEQSQPAVVVEKRPLNVRLMIQIAGALVGVAVLIFGGIAIKNALFPNTATLAVLTTSSSGPGNPEYTLNAGLVTLLAQDFARRERVFALSPSSSLMVGGTGKSKHEIANELNVKQLVLIKARQSSSGITVDVELFDVDEQTIWNGTFTASNLLQARTLRSELVSTVLDQLGVSSETVDVSSPSTNEDAFRLYLAGLSLVNMGTTASTLRGLDYINAALRADSTFGLAYAARAHAAVQLFKAGGESNKALLTMALADLQTSARQQETALSYQVFGELSRYRQKFVEAKEAFQKSLSLQPANPACYRGLAMVALAEGAYDQATDHARTATSLDPKNPETALVSGLVFHFKKEYEQALNQYNRAIDLGAKDSLVTVLYRLNAWAVLEMRKEATDYCKKLQLQYPQSYRTNYWVARALQQQGQWDESKPYLEQALQLAEKERTASPDDFSLRGFLVLIKARLAKLEEAKKEIELLVQLPMVPAEMLYRRANVYTIEGQQGRAQAFNALKQAVMKEFNPAEIFSPDFVAIMKEPEFAQALVRSAGQ